MGRALTLQEALQMGSNFLTKSQMKLLYRGGMVRDEDGNWGSVQDGDPVDRHQRATLPLDDHRTTDAQEPTMMTIKDWIDTATERADAATPGPWAVLWRDHVVTDWERKAVDGHMPSGGYMLGHSIVQRMDEREDNEPGAAGVDQDAEFIASARTDLPMALSALSGVLGLCDHKEAAGEGDQISADKIRAAIAVGLALPR